MHMFVTFHEKGVGLRTLTNTLNVMHFGPNGIPPIGYTAVRNCVQREANRVLKTKRKNQCSNDNTFWCHACFNFSLQFALRLGLRDKIPPEKILG